jgi:cytosine/adenosine deaminase-related metal-dependent hydrolase
VSVLAAAAPAVARDATAGILLQVDTTVVFLDVGVVDVDRGVVVAGRAVLVRDGVIVDVSDAAAFTVPAGARVIPGEGRTLMPGLVDTHVHVHNPADLVLLLAHGVTSARILDGEGSDLRMRDGGSPLEMRPRLRVCRQVNGVDGPEDAVRTVRRAREDGYDCLKLYSPPPWTLDGYRALARAAAESGIPLDGHLPRNLALTELLAAEAQTSIAHLEETLYTHFYLESNRPAGGVDSAQAAVVAQLVADRDVAVVTTLNNYRTVGATATEGFDSLKALPELAWAPGSVRERWSRDDNVFRRRISPENGAVLLTVLHPVLEKLAREILARGATLAVGTDASWNLPFMIPGPSIHWEMVALVRAGLPPADVLRAATVNGAALLGQERTGRIAAGWVADLVLVEGNPLEDVAHLAGLGGVMRGGVWFPAERLKAALDSLAAERR